MWLHTGKLISKPIASKKEEPEAIKVEEKQDEVTKVADTPVMVQVARKNADHVSLALETYLEGVVGSEMPVGFSMEALKAQCVASRTFAAARGFKVDDTTSSQVFYDEAQQREKWKDDYDANIQRVKQAIQETRGEVLTYQGELISAVFFSSSCGKTANAQEYWKNASPYLRSVDSPWDEGASGFESVKYLDANTFAQLLGFQNPVQQIGEAIRYDSGYVEQITIDGITFSGRVIREKLGLRSSCFWILAAKDGYDVKTKGYGHGLGMSQYGAQGMAEEGYDYKAILTHYYTDVKIEKKYV